MNLNYFSLKNFSKTMKHTIFLKIKILDAYWGIFHNFEQDNVMAQ